MRPESEIFTGRVSNGSPARNRLSSGLNTSRLCSIVSARRSVSVIRLSPRAEARRTVTR